MDDWASGGVWCTEGGTLYCSSLRVSWFQQGVYTGDWCLIKRLRYHLVSTAKGQEHPCNCLCKLIFTPIRKINAQLQFSQTGTTSAEMGSYWKISWLFIRLAWFQVYMDNNPLTYVQESKLGASQIQWLSELVHCSILPSNTEQAISTGLQMH